MGVEPAVLADPVLELRDLSAEMLLCGAVIHDKGVLDQIGHVAPEDFFEPKLGNLWRTLCKRIRQGKSANLYTLAHEFDPAGELVGLLRNMVDAAELSQPSEILWAAEHVIELAGKRSLAIMARDTRERALNGSTAEETLAILRSEYEQAARGISRDAEREVVCASSWTGEAPARLWLVPEWLPLAVPVLLGGAGGQGKSLLAQQLMTAVATGRPWIGLETGIEGPALGVMCEDEPDELHRRQQAIRASYGLQEGADRHCHFWPRIGKVNTLMRFDRDGEAVLTPLYEQLRQTARRIGARVIILDTVAHIFGGNENIRPQVTAFITGCLQALAHECQATVIITAHPSRAGMSDGSGLSGSTAWEGTVRARLYLAKPDDPTLGKDARVLKRMKANYGPADAEHPITWRQGAFCPLAPVDRAPCDAVLLAVLRDLTAQGRNASDRVRAANYLPKLCLSHPLNCGYRLMDFERALEQQRHIRRVQVERYKGSNRVDYERLVLVGE